MILRAKSDLFESLECQREGVEIYFVGTYQGKVFELTYNSITETWFWINEGNTELTRMHLKHKVMPELSRIMR